MKRYKKRIYDTILKDKLEITGGVLIEGPKACGKTTTALQLSKSVLHIDEPSKKEQYIKLATYNPEELLLGETPRLIDEWQYTPELWDCARYEIDKRQNAGQFIFTGSAVPINSSKISHSGAGRFSWITMRTMSLFESEDSIGSVSLTSLFNSPNKISGHKPFTLDSLANLICRGGWPNAVNMQGNKSLKLATEYYEAIVRSDINRADGVHKNETRVRNILRSFSRNICGQASIKTIKNDIAVNDSSSADEDTIISYLTALRKIFVIEDMPSWNPNLRSKSAIRTSDTRYYSDSSIGIAALGLGPSDLINDLNTMGLYFENMCVRDLRIYAQALDGNVYHFRDANGLECDSVIHLRNGKYGLVEIKLGGDEQINEAAKNLKRLKNKIDTQRMNEPSFLMVLVGMQDFPYRREDGIYVVPITCLKH